MTKYEIENACNGCPNRTMTCHDYDKEKKQYNCPIWGEHEKLKASRYKHKNARFIAENYLYDQAAKKARRARSLGKNGVGQP